LGQLQGSFMTKPEPANYWEYTIRDVEAYRDALSGADLEISQLEPGCLDGRHVRFGVPGGQFSYIETSAQMRGNGTFPNVWTLSVILGSETRSQQYGIEVRAGSLVIHRPGGEHDAIYGRNFKVACISVQDEVFAEQFPQLHPHLQAAMRRSGSVFELPANSREKIIEHFAEGAAIIQSDPQVRNSSRAVAKFEEEFVCDFLEAVEQQLPTHSNGAEQRAAAMVRQIDQYVHKSLLVNSSVAEFSAACQVPRRTLNRAFQSAVGMGPATYLRRVRLNGVRRALQQPSADSTSVTDVALQFGFWHLSTSC
jgi:AraC family ethanolamine operon transcriptional activator